MGQTDLLRKICIEGTSLLKSIKRYSQKQVVQKMEFEGYKTSPASFSNLLTDNKDVSLKKLELTAEAIKKVVHKEILLEWNGEKFITIKNKEQQPEVIPTPTQENMPVGFKIYERGRLYTHEKVEFMSRAQKEIIEFGVSLSSFSEYFIKRKYEEFRQPVEQLLERGVNFKCYLLWPSSPLVMKYFSDQSGYIKSDADFVKKINTSVNRLKDVQADMKEKKLSGRFEIFQYDLIPSAHMLVIDGGEEMLVSPYMHGLLRADCPVFQFSKKHHLQLVRKYMDSLKAMTKNAKKAVLPTR